MDNLIDKIRSRLGDGYAVASEVEIYPRRIDYLAIGLWASTGNKVIAYELKKSIADLRNEIKHPEKSEDVMRASNEFYLVAPKGIVAMKTGEKGIHISEIPGAWGYMMLGKVNMLLKKPAEKRGSFPSLEVYGAFLKRVLANSADELEERLRYQRKKSFDEGAASCPKIFDEKKQRQLDFFNDLATQCGGRWGGVFDIDGKFKDKHSGVMDSFYYERLYNSLRRYSMSQRIMENIDTLVKYLLRVSETSKGLMSELDALRKKDKKHE